MENIEISFQKDTRRTRTGDHRGDESPAGLHKRHKKEHEEKRGRDQSKDQDDE